ncbi:MAG: fibronectin type III domain-containing protein, partial [Bacteroidota bacterium]|nr:fibronectin type III domain-containing protein [Bacteroidota bacterium]
DWNSANGAISYSVQYRIAGGTWYNLPGGPFYDTWATISGLQPGTSYEWSVRTNCSNGSYSYWSYYEYFTTQGYSCSTPTWPTTSNITQTSANFSWDPVYGAQNYSVQYRLLNGTWYDVPGGPFTNPYASINGLNQGTTYQWRVRANCSNGQYSYWTSSVTFTTLGGSYCTAPTGLVTANITQNSATFDWVIVQGAENYSVQWRVAGGTWYNLSGGPFYNTYVNVSGLTPNTSYEWRVKSHCTNGSTSEWSNIAYFTTLGYSCYTPTWPTTSNITESSANLSWDAVAGAQNYSVQYRLPNGTWYNAPGSPTNNTWLALTNLNANTMYEWRVRANCGGGQYSNYTYPTSFTTLGGSYCIAPNWLNTSNVGQNTATWEWSAVAGAYSYSVQWRYPGGSWHDLSGGPWQVTWLNVGGLNACTTYEWRVRSNCSNYSYSSWSYVETFTTQCYSCSTPTWPTTSNIGETSATFSWDPVSGAVSYNVQTRLPNGTWYDIPGNPVYGTSTTVTGLNPNTTYQWRVRANCSNGNYSYWTSGTTFITQGQSCYAPNWLYTANITQTSASLDWNGVSGAVSYSVQWRVPGGTWYDLDGNPWTSSWADINGLQPGTNYEWRVRANCYNGNYSGWSYVAFFTTLGGYSCSTPTWPTTSNITQSSATLSWDPVSGAQNYSVQIRLQNGTWYDVSGGPFYNTSVTVNNLNSNTTYQWRVRANCNNWQYSNWTAGTTFTTQGGSSCNAPTWLYTGSITQSSATLDWSGASGAVSYTVEYRIAGGTWYTLSGGPFYDSWAYISGLQSGTTYEWRVRSNCSNGVYSSWSSIAYFTTLGYSCGVPTWPTTSGITQTTANFSWDPVSGAQSYSLQTRLPNGTWYDVPGGPFTNTTVTVSGFNPNTTYQWRVRANCSNGQYSNWTSGTTFTTTGGSGGGNDYCDNATTLTVGSSCSYTGATTIGATASTPPPMGNCSSTGYKDVWFKFTVPASGIATIRTTAGSLTDGVMEVYQGTSCAALTYLTCEDDNLNGNNSTMPVVNLTATPGATIYIRLWGYYGSAGTFSICVIDYMSVNFAEVDDAEQPIDGEQLDEVEASPVVKEEVTFSPASHVSPNPTNDVLNVRVDQTEDAYVTGIIMHDLSGKVVLRKSYQSEGTIEFRDQLEVSGFAPGMYILQIMTTKGIISEKVSVIE